MEGKILFIIKYCKYPKGIRRSRRIKIKIIRGKIFYAQRVKSFWIFDGKPNITGLVMRVSKLWSFYRYPWISQEFSDCGLHNGKYTKNQPIGNCVFRA
jgi:hypothetical protein